MPLDWSPFVDLVRRRGRFLMTTHVRPDGDGLGSMLALAEALEALGKEVRMTVASVIPPRYHFLDPQRRVTTFAAPGSEYRGADAVLVLDTGTWNQLGAFGDFLKGETGEKVVVDHHVTQDDLGALRLVDVSAEATGRLAFEAMSALGISLTPSMASRLFVALAMDTGWFRHSNATPRTFELAARLVDAGARPPALYEELFERSSVARMKLIGRVLDRLQVIEGGRVAFLELRRTDYEATGATPQDSEDLIDYTRSMKGILVGIFFMEQPRGGVKVSFRSREAVDVAKIAEAFGGGGHRRASGAIVDRPFDEVRARVLAAVALALPPSDI